MQKQAGSIYSQVPTLVTSSLNTAAPDSPTADSLLDIMSKATGGKAYDKSTDSLEAIRDALDAVAASNTLATLLTAVNLRPALKRSAQSGDLLMDGSEQTLYEKNGGADPFVFYNGIIYIPNVASGATTVKFYMKLYSGDTYRLINVASCDHSVNPVYCSTFNSTWLAQSVGITYNKYGIKITAQQTAGVNQTFSSEFFDSLG